MMENKLNFEFRTTQIISSKITQIEKFSTKWALIERKSNRYLKHLKEVETIKSVGASTRIEGSTLTNYEVETLLNNMKISDLKSRDEQEVGGYYEVLDTIFKSYEDIDLTESNIRSLHNILLRHSQKDQSHKGNYKQLPNKVVANYPDGTQKTIFRTTEPFLSGKEMTDLVKWTSSEFEKKELNNLLIIGTFIYEFLSIHPFQDGNGRLSRLLTTLLLLRKGYDFVQYVSFENIIEENKKDYYKALMDGQKNRYSDLEKIDKWLNFFLDSLLILTKRLDKKYDKIKSKKPKLNERQMKIVNFIQDNHDVGINDILKSNESFIRSTLKKDLTYLVQNFHLNKIGKGRSTVYEIRNDEEE